MTRAIVKLITAMVLATAVAACASDPSEAVPLEERLAQLGYAIGQPVKRVVNFQLSSWNSVDRKHVIMNFGASRNYLLTLRTSCDGLRTATVINFSTTAGNLTDRDKLLVRNDSHHLSHCYISTINELEKVRKTGREN